MGKQERVVVLFLVIQETKVMTRLVTYVERGRDQTPSERDVSWLQTSHFFLSARSVVIIFNSSFLVSWYDGFMEVNKRFIVLIIFACEMSGLDG